MYQTNLFSSACSNKTWLGSGVIAEVWALDSEWVVKCAKVKDLTLNWLEFCLFHKRAGTLMRGMPEVDCLIYHDDGEDARDIGRRGPNGCPSPSMLPPRCDSGYTATMRRYAPINVDAIGSPDVYEIKGLDYIKKAKAAFVLWLALNYDREVSYFDEHEGNFMFDERTEDYIFTDPSAGEYCARVSPKPLTLN